MSGWTKKRRLDPNKLAVVKSTIVSLCLTAVETSCPTAGAPGRAVSVVATSFHRRLGLVDE